MAQAPGAVQAKTLVDLLVTAEVRTPEVIVVAEDFPRLTDGLSQLRRLARVVVVGDSRWADLRAADVSMSALHALLAPRTGARGQLVAVWGPQGSWGVTTVALGLARSLAERAPTLLLDVNVHVPGIGEQVSAPLGGLLEACLSADRADLRLPIREAANLAVLTGVKPDMYPAVHAAALQQVLDLGRDRYTWVVADTDSALDPAAETGLVPDWTSATAVTLGGADQVVIVVGESDVAQSRLWLAMPAVSEVLQGRATVVINRCSSPRKATAALAARMGDHLPEAAIGWISGEVTVKSLRPIVAEVTRAVAG